jgi:hypothetical protein
MLARFLFDVSARWVFVQRQTIDRESKQPVVIMPGHAEHARIPREGSAGELGQLPIVAER